MSYDFKNRYFSRRQFLVGTGSNILLLPLLTSLLPKELALAATNTPQRTLCLFPFFMGLHSRYLQPDPVAVAPYMKQHIPNVTYAPLASLPRPISYMIDSNYDSILPYVNVFQGLDFTTDFGHTFGQFAGVGEAIIDGHQNRVPIVGKSIDVVIEQSAAFKASFQGKFPTLRISGSKQYAGGATTATDRDAAGNPTSLPFLYGDLALFNKLFATSSTGTGNSGLTLSQRKLLVADSVLEDLNRLKNLQRISSEDKLMLDRYMTGIFDLQKNLQTAPTLTCNKPTLNFQITSPALASPSASKYFANIFDMTMLAMACGQSRMLHLMNFIGTDTFGGFLHHNGDTLNHDGTDLQNWYIQQIVAFAKKMQAFPDPSGQGSMLDQTLMIFCQEHEGRAAHSHKNLPIFTIGKLGNSVTGGNFIKYSHKSASGANKGYLMKMLLISAMQGMGVTKPEWTQVGDGSGFGLWGSLGDTNYSNIKSIANDPLPLFTTGT